MKKLNSYALAMLQKYGPEWDTPLFRKKKKKNNLISRHSVGRVIPERFNRESIPMYIDDSTEHKASIYDKLDAEKQMLKVFEIIEELGGTATDNAIARKMNIQPSTVSARRNELRDRGLIVPLLDFYGKKVKKRDHITGQLNTVWKINK